MEPAPSSFSEVQLDRVRDVCRAEPRIAALYALDLDRRGDYRLAALFAETPAWPERLDLEMAVARALGLEATELIDLRRMPLVFRYSAIRQGQPIYVGEPDRLAFFIELTLARYSAFYPLLEALYWRVETGPLLEDQIGGEQESG